METRVPKIPGSEHPITIHATGERVVVRANGRVVADTTTALTLNEAGYPPVHYIPIGDVDQTLLRPSTTSTYCPYKGEASYFSIVGPDGPIDDAVWTYEHPYPAMAAIGGHVAFYPDKVEIAVSPRTAGDAADGRSARERLLAAAGELFYAEGIQTVGIDRIIERAGVAKASLYNLFGSKEGLACAYLEARHSGTTERITAAVGRHRNPRKRLLAVFEAQGQIFGEPNFRGCAFIAASAEAPPGGLVEQAADGYRTWIRTLFTDLAEQAGAANPAQLARQLQVIYDGAGIAARMDRDPSIAASARAAAEALLDASL